MDFEDRLADYVETLDVGLPLYFDMTSEDESLSIASLPGGTTKRVYMDGAKEKVLNYEIVAKVKMENREKATRALYKISKALSELEELPSHNDSYEFEDITISNEMFASDIGNGYRCFGITLQPQLKIN